MCPSWLRSVQWSPRFGVEKRRKKEEERRNHSGKILALRHRDVVRAKYVNINAYLCWPFTILLSLTLVARSKAGLYRSVTGANRIDTALHPAARSYNAYAAVESWFSVQIWLHTAYVLLSVQNDFWHKLGIMVRCNALSYCGNMAQS